MTNELTIAKSEHGMQQEILFAWIKKDFNSDNIDISDFLSHDGTLDKEAMQKAIKEELIENYQKTLNWQSVAILKAFPTD